MIENAAWHLQAFEHPFTLTAAEGALTSVDLLVFRRPEAP